MTDHNLLARIQELNREREMQQKLYLSDITRARRAGQGQALKELGEYLAGKAAQYGPDDLEPEYIEGFKDAVATAALWISDKLKELGEEPREVRNAEPR